jgi:hypothetical protein
MIKAICAVLLLSAVLIGAAEVSPALKSLQGNWTAERTGSDGQRGKAVLQIKDDKLDFRLLNNEGDLRFFAKGTVKVEKAGDFRILVATGLRAGRSEDDLQPVDEDRASVYTIHEGKLYLATGFDRARENERPRLDEYVKQEGGTRATK